MSEYPDDYVPFTHNGQTHMIHPCFIRALNTDIEALFRGHASDLGQSENAQEDGYNESDCIRASIARKESPFLVTKEAAFYLRLSSQTLNKMRMQNRGPCFRKHGRYVRYHIDDLENWSKGKRHLLNTDMRNP